MKRSRLSQATVLACLVAVAIAAWWGFQQRSSPGPLHPSHAMVAALRGNAGCNACHGDGEIVAGASFETACNSCHEEIGGQIERRQGIHGALDRDAVADCAACHHEHVGESLALVSTLAFQRAGIADPALYDHAHSGGLALEGRHIELDCAGCHVQARNLAIEEGHHRFLGLAKECTACHNDAHKGELGNDCAKCHGQEKPFGEAALFAHPKTFPLDGGHDRLKCSQCHTTTAVYTGLSISCTSCHQKDFEGTTQPEHRLAGLSTDCASCHMDGAAAAKDWKTTTFRHTDRFALVGGHEPLACSACHARGAPQDQVIRHSKQAACTACHDSPHEKAFVSAALAMRGNRGDACTVCHLESHASWRDAVSAMPAQLHAATGFALVAPHDTQQCSECHAGLDKPRTAAGVRSVAAWHTDFPGRKPDACEACHGDPHGGQFAGSATHGACLACHARTEFVPSRFDAQMHANCPFPLDGSHRAVACAACHKVVDGVRVFAGTKSACIACHEDVHKGAFDKPGMATAVGGRTDCARCHTTSGFATVTWTGDDHAMWTGERLTGKHATARCDDCHRREAPVRSGGVLARLFKPAPKECAACHDDVHAGQFRTGDGPGAKTDCARCHNSTESFRETTFDHQKDSRFPLDADHRGLACAACHKPVALEGRGIVRFKPLGVQCADCHDSRRSGATGAEGARP